MRDYSNYTEYDIGAAFSVIEDELIDSMIRNMKRHRIEEMTEGFQWEQWQALQLQSLERYRRDNLKRFRNDFKTLNGRMGEIIQVANQTGQMTQEKRVLQAIRRGWKTNGRNGFGRVESAAEFFKINDRKLEALIKATTNDMQRAEVAILRLANDDYRKAIFNAQVYANSGAGTYEKAVDMATKDMLSRGLNCIEYKNGARHTLSDYADMAIRTASKRAYLQGEGVKRQEWGISTVIVNKRGNPCPLCLPFVGKVLIDDVWSGGTSSDGNYPLMSTAVDAGLYHPRCKDSHTTYFPGISTASDKWTREELDNIDKLGKQEAKEQHAKRQIEKYERLARYSLDDENRERYQRKANEWGIVANNAKTDIMESDLGAFKKRLLSDLGINKDYYRALKEKFSHGSDNAKKLFAKYVPNDSVINSSYEGTAQFDPKTKKITMHYIADMNNSRGVGATWFHEHGHLIDDALGNISDNDKFRKLLEEDVKRYRIDYGKEHGLKTWDKVDKAISQDLDDMRKHSAVSDLMDGVTGGNISGVARHSREYWLDTRNISSEAFAHMYEAQFDKVRYNEMKKYFPKSIEYFEEMMKEGLK